MFPFAVQMHAPFLNSVPALEVAIIHLLQSHCCSVIGMRAVAAAQGPSDMKLLEAAFRVHRRQSAWAMTVSMAVVTDVGHAARMQAADWAVGKLLMSCNPYTTSQMPGQSWLLQAWILRFFSICLRGAPCKVAVSAISLQHIFTVLLLHGPQDTGAWAVQNEHACLEPQIARVSFLQVRQCILLHLVSWAGSWYMEDTEHIVIVTMHLQLVCEPGLLFPIILGVNTQSSSS